MFFWIYAISCTPNLIYFTSNTPHERHSQSNSTHEWCHVSSTSTIEINEPERDDLLRRLD